MQTQTHEQDGGPTVPLITRGIGMTDDGKHAWTQAVAFTRDRSPASFDQWFSGVQFDSFTDGVLCLRARDEFVRQWVDDYFLPTITDWLQLNTGLSVQVRWSIDGALDTPVAERPSSFAPVRPRAISVRPGAPSEPPAPRMEASAPFAPPARVFAVPPPIEGLNPKNTFANFVVGPSNQLAYAASMAAAGVGGRRHNPLFIYGGTGLGKTHLVHALAYRIREERPETRIVYISAERFVNEFVQALTDQKMHEFRGRFREKCDLLLVDDIHFLAGKTQTQEEFFHAFNALHQSGKQIVVTSDKYPQQLDKMEERLVSRFQWGLVADIQAPELETRVAIVRKKAQLEHIEVNDEVCLYIAQSVRSNVRELEGTLIRLAAKASLLSKPIDIDFTRAEMAATLSVRPNEASVEDIQRAVCHHFKLRSTDLLSKDRHKSVAFARHVAMYLCKQRLKCSFPELGRAFGNRDHTTVISAVRKVEALRSKDPEVRAHLEALEKKLGTLE
ncbi:MAG TPA: chromosomal replication initiator protein DnaA [Polyangiaceae bacterium]|jgi:chromosomal replication initiator protein|nr:chromosomal replication initiator protein DnaA [Polyangiaceae bacterium]